MSLPGCASPVRHPQALAIPERRAQSAPPATQREVSAAARGATSAWRGTRTSAVEVSKASGSPALPSDGRTVVVVSLAGDATVRLRGSTSCAFTTSISGNFPCRPPSSARDSWTRWASPTISSGPRRPGPGCVSTGPSSRAPWAATGRFATHGRVLRSRQVHLVPVHRASGFNGTHSLLVGLAPSGARLSPTTFE